MLLGVAVGMAAACKSGSGLTARVPHVDVAVKEGTGGSFVVRLEDVGDAKTCARHGSFADFCVRKLRSALYGGIRTLLGRFIDARRQGQKYSASFELLEFSQAKTFVGDADYDVPKVVLRWRFELRDERGKRLLSIKESTDRNVLDARVADDVLASLLEDIMEEVAEGLSEVDWPGHARSR
jgi:hypothetical protein